MSNPFSLEGKTILVTGASSGIGKAIAIECSNLDANVIISGRCENRLSETFRLLKSNKIPHLSVLSDLSNHEELSSFVDKLPNVDGVVHCAGITKILPFQFMSKQSLSSVMDINFVAPALLSQSLIKRKKLNRCSSIVFVSSISGILCSAVASSIYSASKGALNGLLKGMAIDLAPKGIRVNSVNPGMIDTNIFADGSITIEQLNEDIKKYPLKRYGKPEEVAYAVIYLLSDASKWVTGSNLVIDGGYTLL